MTNDLSPRLHDRLTVLRDGEEIEVFNWVNINQPAIVRASNPVVETFDADIGAGDSPRKPDAVSKWLADELRDEFNIDPEDHDIEVVDVESEEVDVV